MKKVLIAILFVVSAGRAQTVIGKYAGEFMAIGVGGRALGMGGAYAALAGDATAAYWNPAALARIEYPDIVAMHDERFGGMVNYDFGSVALPYGERATVALSILRLGVDGIPDTRNAWVDVNGNGLFDDDNRPDYGAISRFNAADWAIYLSYARSGETLAYGANVKIIRRDLAEHGATGIGFDVGVLYSPLADLWLALNAQDVTTTFVAWSTGRTELITPTLKFGSAYVLELWEGTLTPTLDVDVRFEHRRFASVAYVKIPYLGAASLDPRLGLEFDFRKTVALRVGYNDVGQFTLGAGVHLRKLDVDYSFARFGSAGNDLGDTHRISLRLMLQEDRFRREGK